MVQEAGFQEDNADNSAWRQDCSWDQVGKSSQDPLQTICTYPHGSHQPGWTELSLIALGITSPQLDAVVIDFKSFSVSFKTLHWCTGDHPVWKNFSQCSQSVLLALLQEGLLSSSQHQRPAAICNATFLCKECLLYLVVVTSTTLVLCLVKCFVSFLLPQLLWEYCLCDS